ncbi:DUF951 domain-containing protein [Clostridium sp. CM028]|uniref:DUF951 domain-containing protein n=1 Tax=unclassified Clostridium TaxID=2614128 RepID=UPI001C0C6CA8|nr:MULTISPECIES: DUF951 domain-containing protein [unclassified Clostridium]MBU3091146.1 DUF951 domain-containing protein [Clostridium sp. CF011]MBW9144872.1 DUF951 domain-containing protein [Clostridium sp. CM027]MBW9148709.1 DUF951 domain-containing protein [Clostridium sp. CM028]UVE40015.1 DUF951 domain-containing protein [Clostridium sp. CM027]WAG68938.1 DUF951 domain-containing protein [Clostridium sp. CF011]
MKVFNLGDIVEMKKTHPCGSKNWEIIRLGADIKIKCLGCARIVMLPRIKFDLGVKKIIKENVLNKEKGITKEKAPIKK